MLSWSIGLMDMGADASIGGTLAAGLCCDISDESEYVTFCNK
jgi:hypothetical protein